MRAGIVSGLVGAGLLLAVPWPARAVSFDCNQASTPDEVAICADPALSRLDDRVAVAFAGAKRTAGTGSALSVAHAFLAQRGACGANRRCIRAAMLGALDRYQTLSSGDDSADAAPATPDDADASPARAGLPTRVGQCATTAVAQVAPRLGEEGKPIQPEDWESGTGITFTNGGYQVSYEQEPALRASRPGDPVRLCLVELPKDCPPGDDRGRIYRGTNLRTHRSWTLPDSQHSCGGA